ncbi:Ail/Lom family outer membrane beta-barrel protein [Escherichia coli]|nr:Ail/Lom family outer membrane beta-barrel protein [Escherichia coli]
MGKGSSKGHTPREAKDNLKSTQLLSVIDAISEGPIEGPVDGLKSVLLNSTPVLDSEGNTNISGVTVVFRAGEQEQTPPEGFESSGSETVLGTEVKYDTPITRTITSANIDRLRFTFGVQALVETTSKGDRNPSEVRLLVQIQRNGGWVTEKDITIKGKTTSQYLASVVVDNLPPRPFNIRMRRMTPDSTTDQLQNKTLWSSYTEIIDVKQCYPNTALVGVQVDSEQFGSQQVSRNYHLRGRILQVPSNYNPQTRQYSGIWDGTFKPAYSNNMAWCLWDMLTHPRYGMGKRLGAADVDKWALYVIGQNCDQSVPDGFGGTEPRITCTRWHEDSVRNRWFSVMAGPSVRVNEWFSAYAMAGVAYSRVSTFSGDYLRVTDNKGKTHDVLTGSDDGRHSNTSLAWGAGVQFNPTESVAIDIAYEGSGSGDWRTDGFIVGVGYKF